MDEGYNRLTGLVGVAKEPKKKQDARRASPQPVGKGGWRVSTDSDPVWIRLAAANPVPDGAEPPAGVLAADGLLDLVDERCGHKTHSTEMASRSGRWSRSTGGRACDS